MPLSDTELEQQLMEAGNRLMNTSPSVEQLLALLDEVENCLSRVEQSPSQSMQNALSPSLEALVTDPIFRHPDVDVKVAVASCISEITRITAPDAPYDDEHMKEVFQLIVSSFENLFEMSSRSYAKRTSILGTVAKVRSCVVMLDLECDALIIEMFQNFFKTVRAYHPENVFSSMETIMTLVLEESEDISMELLSPLLACVRRDNEEEVLPVARKLAERVLKTCGDKLRNCLTQAVKTLGISLNDYSEVVASICQETFHQIRQDKEAINNQVVQESKPAKAFLEGAFQEDQKNSPGEVDPYDEVILPNDKSAKSVASNGVVLEGDFLQDSSLLKKQEHATDESNAAGDDHVQKSMEKKEARIEEASDDGASKLVLVRRSKSKAKSGRMRKKGTAGVPTKDKIVSSIEEIKRGSSGASYLEANEGTEDSETKPVKHSGKKATLVISDEGKIQHAEDQKNEESGGVSDLDAKEKKLTSVIQKQGTNDSQVQVSGRTRKKVAYGVSSLVKVSLIADETKEEDRGGVSDLEEKPLKLSIKKNSKKENVKKSMPMNLADKKKEARGKHDLEMVEQKPSKMTDVEEMDVCPKSLNHKNDGPHPASKRKRSSEKAVLEKVKQKFSGKTDVEEMNISLKSLNRNNDKSHLKETPKAISKRSTSASKEKASSSVEYDESLVGVKVKVWWPQDKVFYKGVIGSFDSVKKRHKVLYNDGEEEVLNMSKQKWEIIADENESSEDEGTDSANPYASTEMRPKKKMKTTQKSVEKSHVDASPRKPGVATDSKSKGVGTKSGQKLSNTVNSDGKTKGGSTSVNKPEADVVRQKKNHTPKSSSKVADSSLNAIGKSISDGSNTQKSSKSKDDLIGSLKSAKPKEDSSKSSKSKQEIPRISVKGPQSGAKSTRSANRKQKSGLKTTESESEKKELPRTPGSKSKSSKKRRR